MTNAASGTLIVVLDVNFMTFGPVGNPGQAQTDNLIAYLAAPTIIASSGPATPAPASALLVLTGLCAVGLYFGYRRRQAAS